MCRLSWCSVHAVYNSICCILVWSHGVLYFSMVTWCVVFEYDHTVCCIFFLSPSHVGSLCRFCSVPLCVYFSPVTCGISFLSFGMWFQNPVMWCIMCMLCVYFRVLTVSVVCVLQSCHALGCVFLVLSCVCISVLLCSWCISESCWVVCYVVGVFQSPVGWYVM